MQDQCKVQLFCGGYKARFGVEDGQISVVAEEAYQQHSRTLAQSPRSSWSGVQPAATTAIESEMAAAMGTLKVWMQATS